LLHPPRKSCDSLPDGNLSLSWSVCLSAGLHIKLQVDLAEIITEG